MNGIALIYCRVSTRSQQEEGHSLESQEEHCRRKAAELGYAVGRVTQEVYTGAELWDRPQLSRDRMDLKEGRFQALIALDNDRLSRDPIHFAIVAQECARAGVELVLVNAPLDTSPEGMLIQYVKGFAAQVEREKIKERSVRGKRHRVESGKLLNSGVDLFGYRRNRDTGKRSIHESEAATVRRIFRVYAEDAGSLRALARDLMAEGTPSPGAGKYRRSNPEPPKWGASQLALILRNPAYKGDTIAWCYHYEMHNKKHTRRPTEDHVLLPDGTTPPLVSSELWEAAQRRLDASGGAGTRNRLRPYLLRGLIRCSVCGRPRYGHESHGNRRYRCASYDTMGGMCGGSTVPADDIEAWAWDHAARILQDPALITTEVERSRANGPDAMLRSDLEAAERSLAKVDRQVQRLLRLYAEADDGTFPVDDVRRQIAERGEERSAIERTIADVEGRLGQQQTIDGQLAGLSDYCTRVAANLRTLEFTDKRMALDALGIQVFANGPKSEDWEIRGNIPLGGSQFSPVSPYTRP